MSVEVVRNGQILEVTLNRPKANAIDAQTSREMSSVFDSFMRDAELRVAILTGAGTKFFLPDGISAPQTKVNRLNLTTE